VIVAGGFYRELCARPRWDKLYGSGGRAVTSIATLSPGSVFHTYACANWIESLRASAAGLGYSVEATPIQEAITFDYLHPMAKPSLFPPKRRRYPSLNVSGDVVLRFGFVEGDAIVQAQRAIFDPQTGAKPISFFQNGSTCDELAVVLNGAEAIKAVSLELDKAGPALLARWNAAVVVIKMGTQGATVFQHGRDPFRVPAFKSEHVFKIGSGDVFSAVFAHCWGEAGASPEDAALAASVAVSEYVDTRALPFSELPTSAGREGYYRDTIQPNVYLAGPFFDLSQRWLIEESLSLLESLGAEVFSPIHDVGYAENVSEVATQDLDGLIASDVVLALADGRDPGTIFEVGYARALDPPKPVVVLAERFHRHEYTMFTGTGCEVTDDFTTALYKAIWAAST